MARARNIKPGLFKNELLGEADPIYTLLFAGLWTLADKEGRLEYRPKRIKAELFPYRFDLDPSMGLAWLKHESFITVYEIDQKEYIQINNWKRHQSPHHKEQESEIPPPPKPTKTKKPVEKQKDSHACAKHDPSISQDQSKESASTPLIPDSLNLIPDSLSADSLNPSMTMPGAQSTGKFRMHQDWVPESQSWEANLFRAGCKPYSPEQLHEFQTYWLGEQGVFAEPQWQIKFIQSLKRQASKAPPADLKQSRNEVVSGHRRSDWSKGMVNEKP